MSLASVAEFVPDDAPENGLERFLFVAHKCAQCFIDERLVVSAAGVVNLLAKPVQDVLIEADGIAGPLSESPAALRSIGSPRRARCKRRQRHAPGNPYRW